MAGYITTNGMAIDYSDGIGSVTVNGKVWNFEFHEFCGPMFLRKDGQPRRYIPSENHPVWNEFGKWLKKYNKARKKAKGWEIVAIEL